MTIHTKLLVGPAAIGLVLVGLAACAPRITSATGNPADYNVVPEGVLCTEIIPDYRKNYALCADQAAVTDTDNYQKYSASPAEVRVEGVICMHLLPEVRARFPICTPVPVIVPSSAGGGGTYVPPEEIPNYLISSGGASDPHAGGTSAGVEKWRDYTTYTARAGNTCARRTVNNTTGETISTSTTCD